jgi:GTPase
VDITQLLEAARRGDSRAIGRTLTNIENLTPEGRMALSDLFRSGGSGWSTGITGTPGAGKSTLTSALIPHVLDGAESVAVVAVDPSSPFSGGAILGDRIRMGDHAGDERVFIRSVANRGSLGGISDTTPAIVAALDGFGFSEVIIETVGIGQSEVEIATTADTTIVVVSSGWGDAIQVSKAGFLEVADIFVVNKADRDGSHDAVADLVAMLELDTSPKWVPPVIETVATTGRGVDELWSAVCDHRTHLRSSGQDAVRRKERAAAQLAAAVRQTINAKLHLEVGSPDIIDSIADRTVDPWTAAERILDAR